VARSLFPGRVQSRASRRRVTAGSLVVLFGLLGFATPGAAQVGTEAGTPVGIPADNSTLGPVGDPEAETPWAPPEALSGEVRILVAERWGTNPDDVVLDWTRPRTLPALDEFAGLEVLGGGRNGHWIVSIQRPPPAQDRVSIPMKAGIRRWVPVARKVVARGKTLEPEDLEMQAHVHWGPGEHLPEVAEVGWVAQRRIDTGDILSRPGVRPPLMVVSGGTVQLIWTSGALKISLDGVAVGSGSIGETVFVRTEAGTRMSGVITGPGTVLLSTPGTRGES